MSRRHKTVYGAKDYYAHRENRGKRKGERTSEKEVTGRGRTVRDRQTKKRVSAHREENHNRPQINVELSADCPIRLMSSGD